MDLLKSIIDKKYEQLGYAKENNDLYNKIRFFEGNAIGQIGESFVKEIFIKEDLEIDNTKEVVHNEYDIISNGKKIEIKTSRLGKSGTYQFNGINPIYNYDYIILIGISTKRFGYYIIDKKIDYKYVHNARKHYIKINNNNLQLVRMNPDNQVNYKLTLKESAIKYNGLNELVTEIKAILR
jgi:hypothetical protein